MAAVSQGIKVNKRDFGKLLAELHEDLKKNITDLKNDAANARRLKNALEKFFATGEDLVKKMTDEETGFEAYERKAVATQESINTVRVSADSQLESINRALNTVKSNVEEMEKAYEAFTEINEKLEDEETGLEAIYTSADAIKSDIIAVKTNADTIYKEIRKFRDNAASYANEIGDIKQQATSTLTKIQANHKESDDLKKKIDEIFKIGSRGAHSNYFVERRNRLLIISAVWLALFLIFLVATIILAINYILPLADSLKNTDVTVGIEVFLLRFSIITPTLFGALYSLKQFSNDRRLYEKYAFKAISTYSAESSIATLARSLEKFTDDEKDTRIINFAINTFTNMYREPLEPINEKWFFKGKNQLIDLTAEMSQSVGEIKQDVDKLVDASESIKSTEKPT